MCTAAAPQQDTFSTRYGTVMNQNSSLNLRAAIIRKANQAEPGQPIDATLSCLELFGGAVLLGWGLSRRSVPGLILACAGGYLAYRGLRTLNLSKFQPAPPEALHDWTVQDDVDEASWESFPASDPPSYHRGRSYSGNNTAPAGMPVACRNDQPCSLSQVGGYQSGKSQAELTAARPSQGQGPHGRPGPSLHQRP